MSSKNILGSKCDFTCGNNSNNDTETLYLIYFIPALIISNQFLEISAFESKMVEVKTDVHVNGHRFAILSGSKDFSAKLTTLQFFMSLILLSFSTDFDIYLI